VESGSEAEQHSVRIVTSALKEAVEKSAVFFRCVNLPGLREGKNPFEARL
jgi:hypothetical protein